MAKSKLEVLIEKRDQVNAQIQALKARDNARQRKLETRAKVILGGAMLKIARDSDEGMVRLKRLIVEHVSRDSDRKTLLELELVDEVDFEGSKDTESAFSRPDSGGVS